MRFLFIITLLFLPNVVLATTVICPIPTSLSGTFTSSVDKGFMPNRLVLTANENGAYQASLTSYWAPVPNDDGTRGTIGEFEGKLSIPTPWSCVATFSRPESDCHLILRFIGKKTIYLESVGQCEFYHGANAYPQGRYEGK